MSPGWAYALMVASLNPNAYQAVPLVEGTSYYIDAADTVTSIPLALAGGTLVRTESADASNSSLTVSFNIDVRSEVYVCYDSRSAKPAWLSGWVDTDMAVGLSNSSIGYYNVYARRFAAGTVHLSANQADAMYFIVVKESLPIVPRIGWTTLSYDMPYAREVIKQAPQYNVNHLEISHDLIMYASEALLEPQRRADINELIDLAHAYGITSVTVWTHELDTTGIPPEYIADDGTGRPDGNNDELWTWMQQHYIDLFSPGGCPELDGVILTFSEVYREVQDRGNTWGIKHDGFTGTQSLQLTINKVQAVCAQYGKTLYCRTWHGPYVQGWIKDAILANGDKAVWMHNKNLGAALDQPTEDWWYMDAHHPLIGTLPAGYNEMVEFDMGFEWMGRGRYTLCMTSYLKEHWNYALAHGASEGATTRIDRAGSLPFYTANRLNFYAFKEILSNPNADPAAINLAWCQQYFPADAAQDVADHYDEPGSPWQGDTRYMSWEVFYPSLSPINATDGRAIASAAIEHLDRRRAQLEAQTTLDTRDGKNDYETLHNSLAMALLDLGGSFPTAYGFSTFQPATTSQLNPNCSINIRVSSPGLKVSSVTCEYSTNGGGNWTTWPSTCTGTDGTTVTQLVTANGVPFGQFSENLNLIRFSAVDMNNKPYASGSLKVRILNTLGPIWTGFRPIYSCQRNPDCAISVTAGTGIRFAPGTARYTYSTDGGNTWSVPQTSWQNRYECTQKPVAAGWTLVEGGESTNVIVSVSEGILHIQDKSTASGTKIKYTQNWNVNTSVGATVLARMKCAFGSGGHFYASNISVDDSLHGDALYLKGNGMIGLLGYGAIVPVNTSDDYHLYRVTIRNQDINVYYDENPKPIIRGNGAFVQSVTGYPQRLLIGSGSSAGTQDIYYDYVYWTTTSPSQSQSDGTIADSAVFTVYTGLS